MWPFWIRLILLHGPNMRNPEVACSLFRPHPGHGVEPSALSLLLWEDGFMRGGKVFTGAKHLRE